MRKKCELKKKRRFFSEHKRFNCFTYIHKYIREREKEIKWEELRARKKSRKSETSLSQHHTRDTRPSSSAIALIKVKKKIIKKYTKKRDRYRHTREQSVWERAKEQKKHFTFITWCYTLHIHKTTDIPETWIYLLLIHAIFAHEKNSNSFISKRRQKELKKIIITIEHNKKKRRTIQFFSGQQQLT